MPRLCLVTGATGYIGGRLVPQLLDAGYRVRCLVRHPERLAERPWADRVEVCTGDVTRPETLAAAFEGVDVAYYLVHSIASGSDFEETDRRSARAFGAAAASAGTGRLVYLGGLTPAGVPSEQLSAHLRSRAEVGRILLDSGVPTVVLRAAVILGSGSASFEMLRHLSERIPVMVTPRWVNTRIQPIAVGDVLRYLVGAASIEPSVSRTFDVGGPDVLTYRQMMDRYARVAGLPRRIILPVPVLTPRVSSLWVGLVTPVPKGIARPLVESLRHEVVCGEHDIAEYVPDPSDGLTAFEPAVALALARVKAPDTPSLPGTPAGHGGPAGASDASGPSSPGPAVSATPASPGPAVSAAPASPGPAVSATPASPGPAVSAAPGEPTAADPDWAGGTVYTDRREGPVDADASVLWDVVEAIGGDNGWYSFPLAWDVRGLLDRLAGGAGLNRGRRDPRRLEVGDRLDFWRVEALERGRLVRLRAEMRLPGIGWLELRVEDDGPGRSTYAQRAVFHPRGLAGHLYWRLISPFHAIVFGGMVRNIRAAAEAHARAAGPTVKSTAEQAERDRS